MVAITAVLLLIAAFLFMNAVFSDKVKNLVSMEEEQGEADTVVSNNNDGEFRLKIIKHMKEMESTQKELIDVLKNQNTLLQNQIENLEHEIYMLSEKQVNQTKSVIKFNKENARQLAISERETLEYVMMELKKAIEENAGQSAVRETSVETSVEAEESSFSEFLAVPPVAELEEVSGEELFEVSDLPGDDEYVMPDMPEEEEIPDMPEDIDLSQLFDIPELFDGSEEGPAAEAKEEIIEEAAPAAEEEIIEEAAPAAEENTEEPVPAVDPLAGLSADPNAMMTPEDIAKLLAAMGQ